MFKTGELYEVMKTFETQYKSIPWAKSGRFDKEPREIGDNWKHNCYYQNMEVNALFCAFLWGYANGKSVGQASV